MKLRNTSTGEIVNTSGAMAAPQAQSTPQRKPIRLVPADKPTPKMKFNTEGEIRPEEPFTRTALRDLKTIAPYFIPVYGQFKLGKDIGGMLPQNVKSEGGVVGGVMKTAEDVIGGAIQPIINPIESFRDRPFTTLGAWAAPLRFSLTRSAPYASYVDKGITEAAARRGVELTAGMRSRAGVAQLAESISLKSPFVTKLNDRVIQIGKDINESSKKLVRETGESPSLEIAGSKYLDAMDNLRERFEGALSTVYEDFSGSGGNAIPAKVDSTISTLKNILDRKDEVIGGAAGRSVFSRIYNEMVKKPLEKPKTPEASVAFLQKIKEQGKPKEFNPTFQNLKRTRSEIGTLLKSRDPKTTGQKAELESLYAALSDDMNATIVEKMPELDAPLKQANWLYKEGLNTFNSKLGKLIERNKDNPSVIAKYINSPNVPTEQIKQIYEMMGPDGAKQAQSVFLEDLFTKARSPKTENLLGSKLTGRIDNVYGRDNVKARLSPEQYKALTDLEQITRGYDMVERVASGSQTAYLGNIMSRATMLFANPWLGIKLMVGDAGLARILASKAAQRYLTEGYGAIPSLTTPKAKWIGRGLSTYTPMTIAPREQQRKNEPQQ